MQRYTDWLLYGKMSYNVISLLMLCHKILDATAVALPVFCFELLTRYLWLFCFDKWHNFKHRFTHFLTTGADRLFDIFDAINCGYLAHLQIISRYANFSTFLEKRRRLKNLVLLNYV